MKTELGRIQVQGRFRNWGRHGDDDSEDDHDRSFDVHVDHEDDDDDDNRPLDRLDLSEGIRQKFVLSLLIFPTLMCQVLLLILV